MNQRMDILAHVTVDTRIHYAPRRLMNARQHRVILQAPVSAIIWLTVTLVLAIPDTRIQFVLPVRYTISRYHKFSQTLTNVRQRRATRQAHLRALTAQTCSLVIVCRVTRARCARQKSTSACLHRAIHWALLLVTIWWMSSRVHVNRDTRALCVIRVRLQNKTLHYHKLQTFSSAHQTRAI